MPGIGRLGRNAAAHRLLPLGACAATDAPSTSTASAARSSIGLFDFVVANPTMIGFDTK